MNKQFVVIIPKTRLSDFVSYTFANEIRIATAVEKEPGFFDLSSTNKVECHCICAAEKETAFIASEWNAFLVK
jgi:hypothetical protein